MIRTEQEQREIKMFGITAAALKEDIEQSITFKFSGPAMIAMGLMSDAQELLASRIMMVDPAPATEEIRLMLNRAKWILSHYVMEPSN